MSKTEDGREVTSLGGLETPIRSSNGRKPFRLRGKAALRYKRKTLLVLVLAPRLYVVNNDADDEGHSGDCRNQKEY